MWVRLNDEAFRQRLFNAQMQVPPRPGLEFDEAVAALVRARLLARYDEPPADWLRRAAAELRTAERELVRIARPARTVPAVRRPSLGWVPAIGAAVCLLAAIVATVLTLAWLPGAAPAVHAHHRPRPWVVENCNPDQTRCSGEAHNDNSTDQNATTGNVVVIGN